MNYRLALKFDPDEYVCSRLRLLSASFLSASFFCGKKDETFLLSSESLIEKNEEQSGNEQRESSYSIDLWLPNFCRTFILFRELERLWKFEAKEALKALGFQVIKWVYVQVELNQDSSIQTDSKT